VVVTRRHPPEGPDRGGAPEAPGRAPEGSRARLADLGIVAYAAVFPLLQVAVICESPGLGYGPGAWAAGATAVALPLHLRHVAHALRGTRPPHGGLSLLVVAAAVVAVTPWASGTWLPSYHMVLVSALIVLRPPWSLVAAAVVVAVQAPLAAAVDEFIPDAVTYYPLTVVWRSASVFVPIWLVATVRQLRATRRALADEAVVRERVRIDDELRETLGTALEAIVHRGGRAAARPPTDPALAGELEALVQGSRQASADARRLVSSYRSGSLRAELGIAASLLGAAGIRTRLELPPGPLPDVVGEEARNALRSAMARLLRDDAVRACVIRVSGDAGASGEARLELRPEPVGVGP
jgi:two-component system sensor histidine kinase DesK